MEWLIVLELFTFFAGIGLASFLLFRDPRNSINQAFAVSAFGMAGWNFTIFLLLAGIGDALLPGRLAFSFGTMMTYGFTWFTLQFPARVRLYKPFSYVLFALGALFFVVPLLPNFVSHISTANGYIEGDLNQQLFGLWFISFNGIMIFTAILMVARLFRLKGISRARLFQLFIGFGLFFLLSTTTNSILPLFFHDFRFNNLGPIFTLILLGFLANAVLQYRLLNIRWIIGKSFLLSIVGTAIVSFFIAVTFLISDLVSSPIAIGASAVLIVALFRPLEKGVNALIGKLVNRGSYDPAEATKKVFEVVRTYGDLAPLIKKIGELFSKYFSAEEIGIIAFETSSDRVLNAQLHGVDQAVLKKTKDLLTISKWYGNTIVEAGELRWRLQYTPDRALSKKDAKALPILEQLRIEALIPFVVEEKVIGFMIFGKRRYDRALQLKDIQFLDLIRSGISPALENAAKYAEIVKLYEQLSEADKAKSQFIDVVSHRFRTPLSALRWNIETVLDTARLGKDAKDMLTDSHERTMFLVSTLDGLFDALELESGKLKLNVGQVNVQKVLQPIIQAAEHQAAAKGIGFTTNIPSMVIPADEKRLQLVMSTLISNAIQYTQEGEVSVTAKRTNGSAVVEVKDSGIGIPVKDQPKIFDKFYRSSNAVQAYADGQGLGLYLAKALVEKHKGTVTFTSKPGEGTVFTVTLPAK